MRKILIILSSLVLLSACAQSTALIGPAITVGNTGNVMQAGFSYGSNMVIKNATGKTPTEHVTTYVEEKREEKKIKKEITSYLATHIELIRKKLSAKK
jgi:hypothetical protein